MPNDFCTFRRFDLQLRFMFLEHSFSSNYWYSISVLVLCWCQAGLFRSLFRTRCFLWLTLFMVGRYFNCEPWNESFFSIIWNLKLGVAGIVEHCSCTTKPLHLPILFKRICWRRQVLYHIWLFSQLKSNDFVYIAVFVGVNKSSDNCAFAYLFARYGGLIADRGRYICNICFLRWMHLGALIHSTLFVDVTTNRDIVQFAFLYHFIWKASWHKLAEVRMHMSAQNAFWTLPRDLNFANSCKKLAWFNFIYTPYCSTRGMKCAHFCVPIYADIMKLKAIGQWWLSKSYLHFKRMAWRIW